MIHLDTSFVIDLFREERRGRPGPAVQLLEQLEDEPVGASVFVVCELRDGVLGASQSEEERVSVDTLLETLDISYPDDRFAAHYAEVMRTLRRSHRKIATMDLLIGVSALLARASLVTGNVKDFAVIPGLDVVSY